MPSHPDRHLAPGVVIAADTGALGSHKFRRTDNAGVINVAHTNPDFKVEISRGTLTYSEGENSIALPLRSWHVDLDGLAVKVRWEVPDKRNYLDDVLERITAAVRYIDQTVIFTGEWADPDS